MRYLSMIRIDENTDQVPSEQLMTDMGRLIEELTQAGSLISTAGLRPTSEGMRVRLRRGKLTTIDGPFTETKDVIGGYFMVEAPDYDAAVAVARTCPHMEFDGSIEVRLVESR